MRSVDGDFALLAPEHIVYEVPNAITTATLRAPARLMQNESRDAVAEFLAVGLTTFSGSALIGAAMPLVYAYGCAFYGAVYLALAQRVRRPFISADTRLYQRIRRQIDVIWIGNWSLSEPIVAEGMRAALKPGIVRYVSAACRCSITLIKRSGGRR